NPHPGLSKLKNREDEAEWEELAFEKILEWPRDHGAKREPELWPPETAQHNGFPVAVEGTLIAIRAEKGEWCTCYALGDDDLDYHLWLVKEPLDHSPGAGPPERQHAIVVEITPRVRAKHRETWTLERLRKLIHGQTPVRISGWTLFDPEHPEQ